MYSYDPSCVYNQIINEELKFAFYCLFDQFKYWFSHYDLWLLLILVFQCILPLHFFLSVNFFYISSIGKDLIAFSPIFSLMSLRSETSIYLNSYRYDKRCPSGACKISVTFFKEKVSVDYYDVDSIRLLRLCGFVFIVF